MLLLDIIIIAYLRPFVRLNAVLLMLCWPKLNDTTQTTETTLHFLLVTNEGIY